MSETLLTATNLHVTFGGVKALSGASIAIDEGEIVALIGPNGAGKSTILKSIFGLTTLEHGAVHWHNHAISPRPKDMVHRGISYVPQGRQLFPSMSVKENIEMGGYTLTRSIRATRMRDVLSIFPDLIKKLNAPARTLSGGQQQMLALARGLMTDPKVLLLDEPTLGLSPKLVQQVFLKLKEINEQRNTALLIVEHNITSLLSIAHRAYILEHGALVQEGTVSEIHASGVLDTIFTKASATKQK
jgi:branched-chain amino acid transport system ATP-binding protein